MQTKKGSHMVVTYHFYNKEKQDKQDVHLMHFFASPISDAFTGLQIAIFYDALHCVYYQLISVIASRHHPSELCGNTPTILIKSKARTIQNKLGNLISRVDKASISRYFCGISYIFSYYSTSIGL